MGTIIFRDLLHQTEWLSIEYTLLELYPDIKEDMEAHRTAYEKIKRLEANNIDMEIVLDEIKDDFEDDFEDELTTYFDVSGKKNDKKDSQSYALEFMPWQDWLGMRISQDSLRNFNELEIVAHCLYEMTFIDFDDEEIANEKNKLNNIIDNFQNLSEEEKQDKTISIEEVLKRFKDNNE
ncbi:DUF6557 family protein [Polaribacter cellanae]|uniref:Uncharacterized protein n=1 Tax=Polaribacter cellanae TaxID=2818493 RepID=A0A975H7T8_9FLAO|nr:DUF6557 family protein [Polaribacter cellanae]QTE23866.1 hypothetical protein J3359_06245 [Polaribacter cellanae]